MINRIRIDFRGLDPDSVILDGQIRNPAYEERIEQGFLILAIRGTVWFKFIGVFSVKPQIVPLYNIKPYHLLPLY